MIDTQIWSASYLNSAWAIAGTIPLHTPCLHNGCYHFRRPIFSYNIPCNLGTSISKPASEVRGLACRLRLVMACTQSEIADSVGSIAPSEVCKSTSAAHLPENASEYQLLHSNIVTCHGSCLHANVKQNEM